MALYPLGDFITTMKDGLRRALRVQVHNKIGYSQFSFSQAGVRLEPEQEVFLLDTTKPTAIDILEFATVHEQFVQLRIRPYVNGRLVPLTLMRADASKAEGFIPIHIRDSASSIFSINVYDRQKNNYKFSLKRSLYFPEGVVISVRNIASRDAVEQVGVLVCGREFL